MDMICALCIAALYNAYAPLQRRDGNGSLIATEPMHSLDHMKQAVDSGQHLFEPGYSMAIGFYATTMVKGVTMCSTHALFVVHRLDLARL